VDDLVFASVDELVLTASVDEMVFISDDDFFESPFEEDPSLLPLARVPSPPLASLPSPPLPSLPSLASALFCASAPFAFPFLVYRLQASQGRTASHTKRVAGSGELTSTVWDRLDLPPGHPFELRSSSSPPAITPPDSLVVAKGEEWSRRVGRGL
jgi:hypothetical protein